MGLERSQTSASASASTSASNLKRYGKETNDDIGKRKVGDEEICHGLEKVVTIRKGDDCGVAKEDGEGDDDDGDVADDDDGDADDDADLHPPAGEDDEDDGGVAEHRGERDRAVEQRDHYHLAQLKQ